MSRVARRLAPYKWQGLNANRPAAIAVGRLGYFIKPEG